MYFLWLRAMSFLKKEIAKPFFGISYNSYSVKRDHNIFQIQHRNMGFLKNFFARKSKGSVPIVCEKKVTIFGKVKLIFAKYNFKNPQIKIAESKTTLSSIDTCKLQAVTHAKQNICEMPLEKDNTPAYTDIKEDIYTASKESCSYQVVCQPETQPRVENKQFSTADVKFNVDVQPVKREKEDNFSTPPKACPLDSQPISQPESKVIDCSTTNLKTNLQPIEREKEEIFITSSPKNEEPKPIITNKQSSVNNCNTQLVPNYIEPCKIPPKEENKPISDGSQLASKICLPQETPLVKSSRDNCIIKAVNVLQTERNDSDICPIKTNALNDNWERRHAHIKFKPIDTAHIIEEMYHINANVHVPEDKSEKKETHDENLAGNNKIGCIDKKCYNSTSGITISHGDCVDNWERRNAHIKYKHIDTKEKS